MPMMVIPVMVTPMTPMVGGGGTGDSGQGYDSDESGGKGFHECLFGPGRETFAVNRGQLYNAAGTERLL
jgi:hypothetical protein